MKNICFIAYDFSVFGGAEKVLAQIVNELSYNYNIHVISICNSCDKKAYKLNSNIKYNYIEGNQQRIRVLACKTFFPLKKYLKENNIEVVFLLNNYLVPICLPIKPFVKTKFIFCDHGALKNEYNKKPIRLFRFLASKFCNKIVSLTERNLNDYKKIFHTRPNKIDYIYNFIDDKVFEDASDAYDVTSKKIITAGRFSKEKGFDMLVDVAKLVFSEHKDWQWDIYGDGEEFDNIKERIKENELENNVILKGKTNDIYKKYKEYSMYVLPSYREGLPLVLLEAKANKLPIVSFDVVTGPREIVRDNIDGFLVPCYNKKIMANKICDLIENENLRLKFSSESQGNINKFSKKEIMKKWVDLIENL